MIRSSPGTQLQLRYIYMENLIISNAVCNANLACAALVIYEHFLQLDNEVELFWKKRWCVGKILFLTNRYFSLVLLISSAAGIMVPRPSLKLCFMYYHVWQNIAMEVQVILTHAILAHRLHAMYWRRRNVLVFLIAVICTEAAYLSAMKVVGALSLFSVETLTIMTNEPFPGNIFCALHSRRSLYVYSVVLVVETIFLGMALRKAWTHRASQCGSPLMQELSRDSVFYFFMTFCVYLTNLVFWEQDQMPLNTLGLPFSYAFGSIFSNRLLIRIRSAYYVLVPGSSVRHSTIQFT
ncbi:hypothetical protein L208DRAFT_1461566 [Tricholoma matsutake]|nr:hypothetical protein L208DRAFT_1461566 [Tricholoma matsutake 945]